MTYNKHTWTTQELITSDKLNNIEDGIDAVTKEDADYEPYLNRLDVRHGRSYDTTYTMIKVPLYNKKGEKVVLKRGFSQDDPKSTGAENGLSFNQRNHASVLSNASTANILNGVYQLRGRQIHNGIDIGGLENETSSNRWTLAWGDDGMLTSYPPTVTPSELINTYGVKEALVSFYPIYMNGKLMTDAWDVTGTDRHPRTAIFQLDTGEYVFYSNDGRFGTDNVGMSLDQVFDTAKKEFPNIVFGYNLDGGGSSQLYEYGYNHTRPFDNGGHTTRDVRDFLMINDELITERDLNFSKLTDLIGTLREKQTDNEADFRNYNSRRTGNVILGGENNTAGQGVYVYNENNELTNSLFLRPDTLQWYRTDLKKVVLDVKYDNIYYNNIKWGIGMNYYATILGEQKTLDNNMPSGKYYFTAENKNSPHYPTDSLVDHTQINSQLAIDIAHSMGSDKDKKRTANGGVYTDWTIL